MRIHVLLKTALKSIFGSKSRSLLTVSGVVIGVFAVISLVALVRGLENYIKGEFESMGSDVLFVYPGSGGLIQDPALAFFNNKLAKKHVTLIEQRAKDVVQYVEPMYQTQGFATYKNETFNATVQAMNARTQEILNLTPAEGRLMSALETRTGENVVVLGDKVKRELFGATKAIGKTINLDGKPFEIVGVLEKKSPEYDPSVFIPLKRGEDMYNLKHYTYILVKLKRDDNIYMDAKKIEIALLADLTQDDFTVYTADDLLGAIENILNMLEIGLATVAGISLLVGGIGIMNIMLVAVSERTREIGLRKALGATPKDITLQFLAEATALSSLGGILGLSLGFGVAKFAQKWLPAEVTPEMALLAVGFSLLMGIVFGTYPARKASQLDAIEALRYE